jgi:predicted acetyltransferase
MSSLATWGPVTPTIRMRLLPWLDAVNATLPLERTREHKVETWMHRPIDIAAAVAARGWPQAPDGAVSFRLVDPDLAWNDGDWHLVVKSGEGRVEPAGATPDLQLHVRGWSALWCGVARSAQLRQSGLLTGGDLREDARLDMTLGSGAAAGAYDYF